MYKLNEVNPLPERCILCEENAKAYNAATGEEKLRMEQEGFSLDCGSCEYAGERFYISRKQELLLQKKSLQKAIERYQRKIEEIDQELFTIS